MLGLDGSSYPDCLPEIPDVVADALTAAVGGVVALCRPQRVGPHLGRRLGTLPERPGLPQLSALLENDNQSCFHAAGFGDTDYFHWIFRC